MSMLKNPRVWLGLAVALLIAAFFIFDLGRWLNFETLQQGRADLLAWVDASPVQASVYYFVAYLVMAALSLPGAAIMTLAGGAMFGLTWGFLLVSFASALGATAAMMIARRLAGEWVQSRYAVQLQSINMGLEADGGFYLFSLRMVPLFPFFVVNLVMGLTRMQAWPFYWISQLGMVPGTLVYVFAGTQLGQIESAGDILSPGLIAAFTVLGLFPLAARKLLQFLRSRKHPAGADKSDDGQTEKVV